MSITSSGKLPTREQIDEKYKWNLKDIYESETKWDEDFKWIIENAKKYDTFKGKLGQSSINLLQCLKFDEGIGTKLHRISLYANLAKDSDLNNSKYQTMNERVSRLASDVSTASAFIVPEVLAIPEEKLFKFIDENEEFKIYKHNMRNLLRLKPYTLSQEQEELMALSGLVTETPYDIFNIFTDADLKFPMVKDEKGSEIEVSHGRYYASLHSQDRDYRERVYKGYYKPFMDYKNTCATLLNGLIKTHIFYAKARKYASSREASLHENAIPISVYDNLIKSINENLQPLQRWAELKKKVLGVETLHPYDTYVSLFPSVQKKYSYEEGKAIVLDALKPFGDNYIKDLQKAFENRWLDVYETKGKRSGAYSSGNTFGVHPYVLLNWNDQLEDVFTLAHEMGHNMHTLYTIQTQPYSYSNYAIFLAEIASTCNEALLLDHLIKNASTKEEKLALIEIYLNNITAAFYRQAGFAEFEQIIHEKTEQGEALAADDFSEIYLDIYSRHWGNTMAVDDEEKHTWARIPHFYYNFYVYQYSTGFAASQALVEMIKTEGKSAIDRYLNFLSAGSSDYPLNILKTAGVDMNSSAPILATVAKMNELLDTMEKLLNE